MTPATHLSGPAFRSCARLAAWGLLLVCGYTAPAQSQAAPDTVANFQLLYTIQADIATFTTDNLLNCYTLSPSGEVVKYNAEGQEQFRYSNERLGALASIDVANPFNVLLYYPDFQTVVTLDRTLNETGRFVLNQTDFLDVPAIGFANDNQVWIYDAINYQLKKVGRKGQVLATSEDLSLLLDLALKPTQLLARENRVLLNDPVHGIFMFDAFGQYDQRLPIRGAQYLRFLDNTLCYLLDGQLQLLDFRTMVPAPLHMPPVWQSAIAQGGYALQRNRFFLLRDQALSVWRF